MQVTITKDLYAAIVSSACAYCDTKKEGKLLGTDRIDSSGIYEEDNVVSCCATCNDMNFLKNTLSVDDFFAQSQLIAARCMGGKSRPRPIEIGR